MHRPKCHIAACLGGLLLAVAGLVATAARAESTPYYLGGSLNLSQESNLLGLADGVAPPPGLAKSDTVTSSSLLAGFDQPLGRQRAYANAALRNIRYSQNTSFDNESYTLAGGLDWATLHNLSGALTASASQALANFNLQEIGLLQQKNLQTTRTLDAVLRMGVAAEWSLEAAGGQRKVSNSLDLDSVQARDFNQDSAALGLRWRPSSLANFSLFGRQTRGRYPKFRSTAAGFEADRFERRDIEFGAGLAASGASSLNLRLGMGSTRYDLNERRDFDGTTGALAWNWQPSAKLRLDTRLSRDVGQDSYAVTVLNTPGLADYSRVNDALHLRVDYAASAKVSLSFGATQSWREIVRTLDNPGVPQDASDRERATTFTLSARWVPTRALLFGCEARNDRRRGGGVLTAARVASDSFSCFAQFTLQ